MIISVDTQKAFDKIQPFMTKLPISKSKSITMQHSMSQFWVTQKTGKKLRPFPQRSGTIQGFLLLPLQHSTRSPGQGS